MKTTFKIVTLVALVFVLNAQAREGVRRSMRGTNSAPAAAGSSESNLDYGFGFSTYGGGTSLATPALSAMIDMTPKVSLQVLFAINGSDPFSFGFGGVLRNIVSGDINGGFHIGAGANLGTFGSGGTTSTSTFFLNLFPVAGFGFSLGGAASNVRLLFDGGAIFHVTPNFQFSFDTISSMAGASIHYMF